MPLKDTRPEITEVMADVKSMPALLVQIYSLAV